jgi:hypothetical protein
MRKPDKVETMTWKGHEVEVRQWCDPTDIPWEDCMDTSVMGDKPEPGVEGWDLVCEVVLKVGEQTFTAFDSLGSVWGDDDDVRREMNDQVIPQALSQLEKEIRAIKKGRDVCKEKLRKDIAGTIVHKWDYGHHYTGV